MYLDIYNTHMELYPYTKGDYPIIESMYTSVDKHSGLEVPCGYIIEDGKLFLPRGTPIGKLETLCEVKGNYVQESDPSENMSKQFYSLYDPRDKLQEDSIKFLTKEGNHQLALNLKTGLGKAEPLSTRLPTPYGSIWMGGIQVGDQVLGSNGQPINVTGVYPQGVKDIYQIDLDDGRLLLCTLEHLWQVMNLTNHRIEVLELGRLMRRHYRHYAIPVIDKHTLHYVSIDRIKFSHQEEAQCIMVDSPDHLYMTREDAITHNTFCVAYASTVLQEKTMIITPNESLKQQWINTYSKMFEYRPKNLINIAGSHIMDSMMAGLVPDADVYFVNHATLRSYMTATSGYNLHKFFKQQNIGIKVYDEAHMEFGNILLVDFFSNTNRTWYLTATFDRSEKTESECFKRAFSSVTAFGEVQSNEVVEKHVVYHVVNINSHISPKERAVVIGYQGMSGASYGKYAFQRDPNQTAYNAILMILEKMKKVEGKTLVFVPLIDAVDDIVKRLKQDFPDKTVAAYHSKISKSEKEDAVEKDIIVSTIKSCGTGKDIPGLRCVVCAEPIASKVVTEQMIGRLRPYAKDKETFFFDIVDISIPPINWWFRSRIKKVTGLCKKVIYLDLDK